MKKQFPIISFEHVSFQYEGQTRENLKDINLTIKSGEFLVITGQSGCGKTTLTRCINNLIPRFFEGTLSGEVIVSGRSIKESDAGEAGKEIASIFQDPRSQFFTTNSSSEVAFACENENAVLKKNSGNKNISSYKEIPYSLPQRAKLSKRPVVVGFGPAGMFAALYLAQCGVRPIVLERGLDVDSRKEKVRTFWEKGILDTECNVQFGEGGAGTFSDGKLNTGVNNPLSKTVFEEFVRHGAPEEIMYEAKPHIGTDKLSETVKNIRKKILMKIIHKDLIISNYT